MEAEEWSWKHLSNDVAADQAASLVFSSNAPVEAYRDGFYASAGYLAAQSPASNLRTSSRAAAEFAFV